MSTETNKKRYTNAEVEALLASEPHPDSASTMTCARLCQKRADDLDLLGDIEEIPVKNRAAFRAFIIGDLHKIALAMKSGNCPAC